MSTSITVVNRNRTLPPLLLPDLRSVYDRQPYSFAPSAVTAGVQPPVLGLKRSPGQGSDLESLASVATKRLKLSGQTGAHMVTPPPTAPVSAAISPSPSYVTFQEGTEHNKAASSPRLEAKKQATISTNSTAKRQRVGPSCDECRLKKIKCDASIQILLQDESLIEQVSEKLHHVFSPAEVAEQKDKILRNVPLPAELFQPESENSTAEDAARRPVLIKHIDKVVLFKPCNSCRKRRASNGNQQPGGRCVFSKGFTRADINVFSRIASRVKGKKMTEMNVEDYRAAGF